MKKYDLSYMVSKEEFESFERFRKDRGCATRAEILRMAVKQYMGKWTEKEKAANTLRALQRRVAKLEGKM